LEGYFKKNMLIGEGSIIYQNGDKYQGEIYNFLRHGKGKMSYFKDNDLMSYTGEWFQDSKFGNGLQEYLNGDIYNGSFKRDQR